LIFKFRYRLRVRSHLAATTDRHHADDSAVLMLQLVAYVREKCGDNIFNTDWSLGLRCTVSRFGEHSGVLS